MATASTMPQPRTKSPWLIEAKERASAFITAFGKHQILMIAGSIAYTTALSLAPFVVILLSVASLLGQGFQNQIFTQMTGLLGKEAGDAIKLVVENADNNQALTTVSGIVGFLILALSASAIFAQLRSALDIINETQEEKQSSGFMGFVKDRLFSFGLVFGFIFLAITSLSVTTLISGLFEGREALLWGIASMVTNLLLFTVLFTTMFRFIPTERRPWRRCWLAGACATVFFLLGKYLIGIYLGNAAVGSAYGAAGSLVVFLVWVYYSAATLLISYEFTNNILIDSSDEKTV